MNTPKPTPAPDREVKPEIVNPPVAEPLVLRTSTQHRKPTEILAHAAVHNVTGLAHRAKRKRSRRRRSNSSTLLQNTPIARSVDQQEHVIKLR
jgi:hypothetical protein